MDLASKILSDTPFKEVNLLNELDHMERSCGQTDASTSTSTAVPCLCQQRVPSVGPLLPGSGWGFAQACARGRHGDAQLPHHQRCGKGLAGERKRNKNFAGSFENLGRSGRCFVLLFFLPILLNFFKTLCCTLELSKCNFPAISSTLKFFRNYQDSVH